MQHNQIQQKLTNTIDKFNTYNLLQLCESIELVYDQYKSIVELQGNDIVDDGVKNAKRDNQSQILHLLLELSQLNSYNLYEHSHNTIDHVHIIQSRRHSMADDNNNHVNQHVLGEMEDSDSSDSWLQQYNQSIEEDLSDYSGDDDTDSNEIDGSNKQNALVVSDAYQSDSQWLNVVYTNRIHSINQYHIPQIVITDEMYMVNQSLSLLLDDCDSLNQHGHCSGKYNKFIDYIHRIHQFQTELAYLIDEYKMSVIHKYFSQSIQLILDNIRINMAEHKSQFNKNNAQYTIISFLHQYKDIFHQLTSLYRLLLPLTSALHNDKLLYTDQQILDYLYDQLQQCLYHYNNTLQTRHILCLLIESIQPVIHRLQFDIFQSHQFDDTHNIELIKLLSTVDLSLYQCKPDTQRIDLYHHLLQHIQSTLSIIPVKQPSSRIKRIVVPYNTQININDIQNNTISNVFDHSLYTELLPYNNTMFNNSVLAPRVSGTTQSIQTQHESISVTIHDIVSRCSTFDKLHISFLLDWFNTIIEQYCAIKPNVTQSEQQNALLNILHNVFIIDRYDLSKIFYLYYYEHRDIPVLINDLNYILQSNHLTCTINTTNTTHTTLQLFKQLNIVYSNTQSTINDEHQVELAHIIQYYLQSVYVLYILNEKFVFTSCHQLNLFKYELYNTVNTIFLYHYQHVITQYNDISQIHSNLYLTSNYSGLHTSINSIHSCLTDLYNQYYINDNYANFSYNTSLYTGYIKQYQFLYTVLLHICSKYNHTISNQLLIQLNYNKFHEF